MRGRLLFQWLTWSLVLLPATAAADPILLGSVAFPSIAGELCCPAGEIRLALVAEDNPYVSSSKAVMFDRAFTEAPTGTTLVATAANEPQFGFFTQLITNGEFNSLGIDVRNLEGPIAGFSSTESGWFRLPNSVDFQGFGITSVELHIDESAVSPEFTDFLLQSTLSVFGEAEQPAPVPEPATVSLLGVGLAVVTTRRWRQRT